MAASLPDTLERLEGKIRLLIERENELRGQLELISREREDLVRENRALRAELEKSDLDNQFLRVSHQLADTPDAVIEARRLIAGLVRTIDKCIAELKE